MVGLSVVQLSSLSDPEYQVLREGTLLVFQAPPPLPPFSSEQNPV